MRRRCGRLAPDPVQPGLLRGDDRIRLIDSRLERGLVRGADRVTGAGDGELAVFEGLEALALGIQGKASLWRALRAAAPGDRRLAGLDFDELEQRAIRQFEAVDSERLALAERVLRGPA